MYQDYFESPIGIIEIKASENNIIALDFCETPSSSTPSPILDSAKFQLNEYFKGTRQLFDLKIKLYGTDFQRSVWKKLLNIPYGQTCSYHDIAKHINNPKAVRAVGAANGKNPIALIVPCHRVIGSNGTLIGYAGGLERKAWLLAHEATYGYQNPNPQLSGF